MVAIAVWGWIAYVLVAFVLRSAIARHAFGSFGIVGLRPGAGALERFGGLVLVASFLLSIVAPFVGAPLGDTTLAGALMVGLATVGTFVAQLTMGRSWRIGVDASERTELVTRGSFAVVRNPIFSWMVVASAGMALSCPTPLALVAPVLLVIGLQIQVRAVEEPYLIATHGEHYLEWAQRTGRFVPGIGKLVAGLGILMVALTACSNDTRGDGVGVVEDPDGTCDSRGSLPLCNDYDADDDDVSFFMMICMGTWSDATPCDRTAACGMCAQPQPGFDATTYYYAGAGPESALASQCADVGGTWIDVPTVACE